MALLPFRLETDSSEYDRSVIVPAMEKCLSPPITPGQTGFAEVCEILSTPKKIAKLFGQRK